MDLGNGRYERRFPSRDIRDVALPVPAVDCGVVAALATRLEQQVGRDIVASAETILR